MSNVRALLMCPLLAVSSLAPAHETGAPVDDAAGYCEMVKGVAAARSSLMVSPDLFVNFGVVNGNDVYGAGVDRLPAALRLTAGVRYSAMRLYEGVYTLRQAEAECDRYRALSALHAFLEAHHDGQSVAALRARLLVLERALPHADEILAALRERLAISRATVDEMNATQLRVDGLRAERAQALAELESVAGRALPPGGAIADLLRARDRAEVEASQVEARLRGAEAWDVALRIGYDQVFGVRDSVPVFGVLSLSWDPGQLFQSAAERRACAGRLRWVHAQVEGVNDRVGQAVNRLRSLERAERLRLRDTRVLLADLTARFEAVSELVGEKVGRYRDYLWFDLVRAQAEDAYLRVHVRDLEAALGETRSAP
jgi:hypothetical protein